MALWPPFGSSHSSKISFHPYVLAMARGSSERGDERTPTSGPAAVAPAQESPATPRAMSLDLSNRRSLASSAGSSSPPQDSLPTFHNSLAFSPMSHGGYGTKTATGNLRIFNCKHCQRAFTREEHLTRHILLTHNKLKPYICGICLRPFSRRDLLLRHAKNLHQGSEVAVLRIRKSCKKSPDDEEERKGSSKDGRMKMSVNMLVS